MQMRIWILSLSLLLSACSSVPVSTMMRMSSMDESTLQEVNATDLRTRITLLPDVSPNLDTTRLIVTTVTGDVERQYTFSLIEVAREPTLLSGGVFSDDIDMMSFTLKLSAEGLQDFNAMQKNFAEHSPDNMGLDVIVRLHNPDDLEEGILSVELLFSPEEDYFTLLDQYHYTVGEIKRY